MSHESLTTDAEQVQPPPWVLVSRRTFLRGAAVTCACGAGVLSAPDSSAWFPEDVGQSVPFEGPNCANAPTGEVPGPADGTKGVIDLARRWNKDSLRVKLLNGDDTDWGRTVQAKIRAIAPLWTDYANVQFEFAANDPADIKVNLKGLRELFNSQIGTDSGRFNASMNLIFLEQNRRMHEAENDRTFHYYILHEFGHALGFLHEHQRQQEIAWVDDKLYQHAKQHWGWSKANVDQQIKESAMSANTVSTRLDPRSVMFYEFPAGLAFHPLPDSKKPDQHRPIVTVMQGQLSPYDKVLAATAYPFAQLGQETLVPGDDPIANNIAKAGAAARFGFGDSPAGRYRLKYSGDMPSLISLLDFPLGPNGRWKVLEVHETPDGLAREMEFQLDMPKRMQIHIRHADGRAGRGEFQVSLEKLT